ncbi:hypothetical protein AAFF_G00113660 [Aldrovandia affinis]|uniref:Uncharacterized protein n=1 Tax=Aldrovandia affinis TaxID=143900 RepID=A0AAD7RT63_9TELE|nr:hypothetical protein AAFF_G00113660 [Aldrovandia affinis]
MLCAHFPKRQWEPGSGRGDVREGGWGRGGSGELAEGPYPRVSCRKERGRLAGTVEDVCLRGSLSAREAGMLSVFTGNRDTGHGTLRFNKARYIAQGADPEQ